MKLNFILIIVIFITITSCENNIENEWSYDLPPSHFPDVKHPEGNELNKHRVDLGKDLFFSTILSLDSTKSCASCHIPKYAFSDTLPFSFGIKNRLGTRNTPSLLNVAYNEKLLRDGIMDALEKQVTVPIHEKLEFDFNIVLAANRMNEDSSWISKSKVAYNRVPDPFVITRALSAFQRTLFSGTSPYDEYLNGNESALNEIEKKGLSLFNGKANCIKCHSGLFFTNESLTNNGLYEKYADSGKMRLTLIEEDRDLFKVPSLRNIEVTAPYMHDGSISTLNEAINHYNTGGKNNKNKSPLIQPLELTNDEKQALILFLKSLTDHKANKHYSQKFN